MTAAKCGKLHFGEKHYKCAHWASVWWHCKSRPQVLRVEGEVAGEDMRMAAVGSQVWGLPVRAERQEQGQKHTGCRGGF